jgi:hypothetical protein
MIRVERHHPSSVTPTLVIPSRLPNKSFYRRETIANMLFRGKRKLGLDRRETERQVSIPEAITDPLCDTTQTGRY